ncbi:14023_t:CDS:1, partial [Acaulospora colombiana]
ETTKWVADIRDLYEAFEADTPQFRRNWWEAAFKTPSYVTNFETPERFFTDWVVPTTNKGVQDRVISKSYVAVQPSNVQEELRKKIDTVLDSHEKVWIDETSGIFEYPYRTTVIAMKKKAN